MKKLIGLFLAILSLASTLIFYKLYQGSIWQNLLLDDFNRTQNFYRPLSQVKQIPDEFPSLGVTTIPIKSAKAFYYLYQDSLEQAKKLLYESLKINPYLGMTESTLSEVYFKENQLDSALIYANKALSLNYRNVRHILNLQNVIFRKKLFSQADSILNFYKDKLYNEEAVGMLYQNHVALLANSKDKFSKSDSIISNYAFNRFPENIVIKNMNQVISNGFDLIILVNDLDKKAQSFFEQKNFSGAAENWENAIQLKKDDAYYLNLFQCLIILEEYEKLEKYFNEFERENLNENDGKFEYLKGLYYIKIENKTSACQNFKISLDKGYKTSKSLIEYNKCK